MTLFGVPVSWFDLALLVPIVGAFVAGSLAVASIERDRRSGRRRFRAQVKAQRQAARIASAASAPTVV